MADPSHDETFDKGKLKPAISKEAGSSSGQPVGGNGSESGSGAPATQGAEPGGRATTGQIQTSPGSEPRRSMGTRGSEFGQFADATGPTGQQGQSGTGQADLGSQAGSILAGRTDQQDVEGVDQPGSYGEGTEDQSDSEDGFILRDGSGSGPKQSRGASSATATEGTDFAREGHGAADDQDQPDTEDRS